MINRSLTTATARTARPLVLGILILLGATTLAAKETDGSPAQVWVISTRSASNCGPTRFDDPRIEYWALAGDRQWIAGDRASFLASDHAGVPTILFVHGNWIQAQEAVNQGWQIYGHLKKQAGGRPFRFVIWSWPSQRIDPHILNDMRIKAARSDVQAYYLAGLLSRIQPEVPVALVGCSFGARAITGALEMLAGGQVAGLALGQPVAAPRARLRAFLMAAAMDSDWLLPGHRNGKALGQVQQMLITRNLADPVLKRYHWLYPGCCAEALGWSGPACASRLGPEQEKLEVVDVTCWVGRNHDFDLYANVEPVSSRLGWYCYLVEGDPQAATAGSSAAPDSAEQR